MQISPIKTKLIKFNENIFSILDQYIANLEENSIIAITSKIISVCEGRVIAKNKINKQDLIKSEADFILDENISHEYSLTIKHNILIPAAGIDESNADGHFILYPKNPQKSCEEIWHYLRKKHQLKNLGLILTDSHTVPLRRGVLGVTLAFCGIKPLYSYVNSKDLFGRDFRMSQINIIDSIAAAAVFIMGEGTESCPMALVKNAPKITFCDKTPSKKDFDELKIQACEDIYAPLLKVFVRTAKKTTGHF